MRYNSEESWRYDAKWNRPDTEEQMLYGSTDMKYLEQSNSYRQEVDQRLPGARGGEREVLLSDDGVMFRVMKKFWKQCWWLYNTVSVINATELYT